MIRFIALKQKVLKNKFEMKVQKINNLLTSIPDIEAGAFVDLILFLASSEIKFIY